MIIVEIENKQLKERYIKDSTSSILSSVSDSTFSIYSSRNKLERNSR